MNDALPVRVVKRRGNLLCDANRFVDHEPTFAREGVLERFAAYVRKDVVGYAVALARVEQSDNARMIEAGGHLDLAQKTLRLYRSRRARSENLERNVTLMPQVASEIHRCHPARADLSLDAIATSEHSVQER